VTICVHPDFDHAPHGDDLFAVGQVIGMGHVQDEICARARRERVFHVHRLHLASPLVPDIPFTPAATRPVALDPPAQPLMRRDIHEETQIEKVAQRREHEKEEPFDDDQGRRGCYLRTVGPAVPDEIVDRTADGAPRLQRRQVGREPVQIQRHRLIEIVAGRIRSVRQAQIIVVLGDRDTAEIRRQVAESHGKGCLPRTGTARNADDDRSGHNRHAVIVMRHTS